MSAYHEQTTQFKDRDLLVSALNECGYGPETISLYQTPQPLYDFHNRKTSYLGLTDSKGKSMHDTAEIIIRREHVGPSANDVGFRLNLITGCYGAVISEFDSYKHNEAWLNRLKVAYAEKGIMRQATRAGLKFTGRKQVNGKTQLQFVQLGR